MKALTLWRPWARYVSTGEKRIENRPWAPPMKMLGETIAIHAGKAWDEDAVSLCIEVLGRDRVDELREDAILAHPEGILGTARIVGWFNFSDDSGVPTKFETLGETVTTDVDDEWCFGPVCWVLRDFKPIATPIPCRGMQKLWNIPADVQLQLDRALAA